MLTSIPEFFHQRRPLAATRAAATWGNPRARSSRLPIGLPVLLWIGAAAAVRACDAGQAIHDSGAILIDLDAGDERSNELATLLPVESVDAGPNLVGEVTDAAHNGGELDGLRELLLCLLQIVACPPEADSDAFAPDDQVIEFNCSRLVGIAQTPQDLLLGRNHFVRVELIYTDLRVVAHASPGEAMRVAADTARSPSRSVLRRLRLLRPRLTSRSAACATSPFRV